MIKALALVSLILVLLIPHRVDGHSADLRADVTLDRAGTPGAPRALTVSLRDVYDNPVPGARFTVIDTQAPGDGDAATLGTLAESDEGVYRGQITVPGEGPVSLRLEANLPGGVWVGRLDLTPAGADQRQEAQVLLRHRDAALIAPFGIAVFVLAGLAFAAGVFGFRPRRALRRSGR